MEKFKLPPRYNGNENNVWLEYNRLAIDHQPLNLGMGFPDFAAPDDIKNALESVSKSNNILLHQYTRGFGHPRLVAALSKLYSPLIGRDINAQTEILVTVGACESLFCSIAGHVQDGDEVIIIEPYFDCYESIVRTAGGIPRFIPLRKIETSGPITSADWVLDKSELENAFNSKTKMILVNTPHNPIGKVFTQSELEIIANLCIKWNALCVSDEVYEWMVYEPKKHVRMATIPGMWERTITIGSAGKTFNITGWRIGWSYGPANLMRNLQVVHQTCVYTCTTLIQEVIALVIEKELSRLSQDDCYFIYLPNMFKSKRDYMVKLLTDVGMRPTIPDGGYFMIADWSPLEPGLNLTQEKDEYKDYRFTKWMTKNVGLLGIPPTSFYSEPNKHLGENLVRYCFIKNEDTLQKAATVLEKWKNSCSVTVK